MDQNILDIPEKEKRKIRGAGIGMIFQDAGASLCPIRTIGEQIYESGGIFMDKHRSRLPVLYVRKHDILKVKWADNDSKYISINKEMRKELKKIYDDSEIESINS